MGMFRVIGISQVGSPVGTYFGGTPAPKHKENKKSNFENIWPESVDLPLFRINVGYILPGVCS